MTRSGHNFLAGLTTLFFAGLLVTSPVILSACNQSNTPTNTPVTSETEGPQIPEQYLGTPEDELPEHVKKEMQGGEPEYPHLEPAIESNEEFD